MKVTFVNEAGNPAHLDKTACDNISKILSNLDSKKQKKKIPIAFKLYGILMILIGIYGICNCIYDASLRKQISQSIEVSAVSEADVVPLPPE